METLLLALMIAGLIWVWARMEALERRVAELEHEREEARFAPPVHVAERPLQRNAMPLQPAFNADANEGFSPPPHPAGTPDAQPLQADAAPLQPASDLNANEVFAPSPEHAEADLPVVERAPRFRLGFDFEEIFGRLLPIWGGGIALAVAGFFLVRWSIEVGMLTQSVRVALSFAFGISLIAAAEIAYRCEHRLKDERVRQALAGAGLASLYASFYLSGSHYGLIGPGIAFAGLAMVTALAILLSFRFGLPSAVLGLVGGFAAPALAGSTDPNLPLLATYLALVTGGLAATGQRQQRPWLGLAALVGGLGWGALMLVSGTLDEGAILAIGLYLVLVGTLLPSMMGTGPLGRIGRVAAAGLATVQIAALVDQSGYSLLAWGCYLLLGGAIAVLGFRFVRLREAGAVAAALSACLLAAWPDAPGGSFALIAAASALVFAATPLLHAWRGEAGRVHWGQLALYPVALIAAVCIHLRLPVLEGQSLTVGLAALALAALPALATWRAWPARDEAIAPAPFATLASAFTLVMLAGLLALPEWSAPLVTAVLSIPATLLLRGRSGTLHRTLPWGIAISGIVLLAWTGHSPEVDRLFGEGPLPQWLFALRWLAAAVPFGLLLAQEANGRAHRVGQTAAAVLGYGAVAMLLAGAWLPLAIALAVLGVAWRIGQFGTALATLLALSLFWAAGPIIGWSAAGLEALGGEPFLLTNLPSLAATMRDVAPLAVALAGAMLLGAEALVGHRRAASLAAVALLAMVAHVAFKQLFAIADLPRFAELGLAERTVWQVLLALAALGLSRLPKRHPAMAPAARIVAVVALAHFALFSLLLHNPLWTEQAVGNWPIANLLLPSYGIAVGLTLWLRTNLRDRAERLRPMFDAGAMVLIALLALSELRQLYSGSLLTGPVGAQEDLLRSILAIAVALGFLGWGARTGQRSWRIGSLALMLLAVFKVFIFDAAGLEGLARIASFFALGVCLIGIGWFYSKQLAARPTPEPIR
jgi:uncharacterized membrane protein